MPATVTPATSTGPRLRQMMPSTTPAATVTAPKTIGPPTVLAALITTVSAPVRCAVTKLAAGWSSAAMPSPSVTSSMRCFLAADTGPTPPARRDLRRAVAPGHGHGAAASTTQAGPRANVIGWPDAVVNVVPPSASARDQRMA